MVGWVNENGFTVLWDEVPRPPNLVNISFAEYPGNYILGLNFFHTRNFALTNIFQRNVSGSAEEFLLGAISVLLIAILSEIVQAVLMHRRRRATGRASRSGVRVAFLVDELYHFRNVVRHLAARRPSSSAARARGAPPPGSAAAAAAASRSRMYTSLAVVCIAFALMAADVFAVYLTQPNLFHSGIGDYNLRGRQPVHTERGRSKWIRRLSRDRPCVTPIFTSSDQERQFSVSACVAAEVSKAHDTLDDLALPVSVASFYHVTGNDHYVAFGNGSFHVQSRAFVYLTEGATSSGVFRTTFDLHMLEDFAFEKFIHELFVYAIVEESCNHKNTTRTCDQAVGTIERLGGRAVDRNITLYHSRKGEINETVTGWQSNYRVTMNNFFFAVDNGLNPLFATAVLEERQAQGTYMNITDDEVISDLDGLLVEEGRMAGLVLFLTIFLLFALTLFILRSTLHPTSLGEMAWSSREGDSLMDSSMSDKTRPRNGSHDGSSTLFDFEEGLGHGGDEGEDALGSMRTFPEEVVSADGESGAQSGAQPDGQAQAERQPPENDKEV